MCGVCTCHSICRNDQMAPSAEMLYSRLLRLLAEGQDPTITLAAFQSLWCHNHALATVDTAQTVHTAKTVDNAQTGTEGKLEL